MSTYNNTQRCCATCGFWAGDRRINSSRNQVETNSMGKCVKTNWNNSGSSSCSRYEKWQMLR